jgi:hypothetical protein
MQQAQQFSASAQDFLESMRSQYQGHDVAVSSPLLSANADRQATSASVMAQPSAQPSVPEVDAQQRHIQPEYQPAFAREQHHFQPAQQPDMQHHIQHAQPEMPLHTAADAQLQHSIASAVAATQPPVDELQDTQNVVGQLAHWSSLERQLRAKATLNPAEELQLSLLVDLQKLQQEQAKQIDQAQRDRAATLVALQQSLGSSAHPIYVPSQSPSHLMPASQPIIRQADLQGPPQPASSHAAVRATPNQQTRLHSARLQKLQDSQPRAPVPKVSWLLEAQNVSRTAAQVKLEQERHEQQQYAIQQSLLAEDAQDQAIIKAAMQRSEQRRALLTSNVAGPTVLAAGSQHLTGRPPSSLKRSLTPSRQDELRMAALTNDSELLRVKSDRVRSETPSVERADEILAEAPALKAAQHLFSKTRTSVKSLIDKNGYVLNAFVRPDDDASSSRSVSTAYETSPEADGDPSSDYVPSSQSGSRSPPNKSFSNAEWQEYQALLAEKKSQQQTHQSDQGPRYNISIAEPPEHGDWKDVQHLMTVFKDKHAKYVKRCGKGDSLSVWECYTETAQESIIRQLQENNADTTRDADFMASLSDAQLYALLQNELGISYDMEVEQALRAIPFVGSILDKPSWV